MEQIVTKDCLQFKERLPDWQEAISFAARPLVKSKCIDERYVDAMIQNVKEHGDYIILVPFVALAHAKSEIGVHHTGVSILRLEHAVTFQSGQEVSLLFCFATKDNTSHLKMLQQLSLLFDEEEKVRLLNSAQTKGEFLELVEKFMEGTQ